MENLLKKAPIGSLDERIEVWEKTVARDEYFAETETWALSFGTFARVEAPSAYANEQYQHEQQMAVHRRVFTVRKRTGYDETRRIRHRANEYDIIAIDDQTLGRNRFLRITGELRK